MKAPSFSGHTVPFAVLGHPIGHTLSPAMHNAALRAMGRDAVYLAFDVRPERLMSVLPAMADMGFGGVNLTVPLKEVACAGLSNLDPSARLLGAVNTVEFTADGLKGHNTDGAGFLRALREAFDAHPRDRGVLVLGAGGAGRAVAITCAVEGAARVAVTDIRPERADKVAREVKALAGAAVLAVPAEPASWKNACRRADLIVQATPVGMRPEEPPLLQPDAFAAGQLVFDLVYMYPETAFMRAARSAGARAVNGLGMLLHQGALALALWLREDVPVQPMRAALEEAVYGH